MLFDHFLIQGACILCGGNTPATALCGNCLADLRHHQPTCSRCGLSLAGAADVAQCGACTQHPPPQSRTVTGCIYAWPADRLMAQFKDHGRLEAGRALLEPLLAELRQENDLPDLVTEVPASRQGLRRRGFQQAKLLTRWISQAMDLPHHPDVLRRSATTRAQRVLSRRDRRTNLINQFHARRQLAGAHVALIDDVITTGSTAAEASRVLLAAGARRVSVWGLARAPRVQPEQEPMH